MPRSKSLLQIYSLIYLRYIYLKANKQEEKFKRLIEILEKLNDIITEYDEEMWLGLVDFVTIKNKEDILVSLKGGMQIAV